jgi:squalene-hopene/tetraprenyl-beta-curcumene cyclase
MRLTIRASCFLSVLAIFPLVSCSRSYKQTLGYADEKASVAPLDHRPADIHTAWDAKSAAAYLDQRETWWAKWPAAERDHATFCVSCHTVMPYVLSRPALRKALAEDGITSNERLILANVAKRVQLWKEVAPYYDDENYGLHKAAQSRATEAVVNAFLLTSIDAQTGRLSEDTRMALADMWALQQTDGDTKGAWLWQVFDLKPWESRGSEYYGATLAAMATGTAPEGYRARPEIQSSLKMLIEYLQLNSSAQSILNRVTLLWASTKLPGLLSTKEKQSIVDEVMAKQRPDGGWNTSSISLTWRDLNLGSFFGKWKRDDGTPQEVQSDGLATGFIIYVLEESGASRQQDQIRRGLDWLVQHQDPKEGSWTSYSLNKRRVPSSNIGHFMTDAATGFAVLALSDADQPRASAY